MKTPHTLALILIGLLTALPVLAQDEPATANDTQVTAPAPAPEEAAAETPESAQETEAEAAPAEPAEAPADTAAQAAPEAPAPTFADVSRTVKDQLDTAVEELNELRARIAAEQIPLNSKLSQLESQLIDARQELQAATRRLDSRNLELANLRKSITSRKDEARYLSNLLSEYLRNLEPRVHIAELQRYEEQIEAARLAPENTNLTEQERFNVQLGMVRTSIERLFDLQGGASYEGYAADEQGNIHEGTFVAVGPEVVFSSKDGKVVGTVDARLNSAEPTVTPFSDEEDTRLTAQVVAQSEGMLPFDPTLGNAHVIEATQDTFIEHVQKGGPVMIPIFLLAGLSLLIAVFKWLGLAAITNPSRKRMQALLTAVEKRDKPGAIAAAKKIGGPAGEMLTIGVEHLGEARELIEELMYEKVLSSTLRLQRYLPFISICAAAAPLLGLLGTVTGIINTFEMITIFGTGDAETLSGGISEALITTKFGLIVAIPSLLLYAYLSRKARGIIDGMGQAGVALMNQIGKTPYTEKKEAA
ncbi:MotA/TolQ/ExbB proton channel family protein [Mucisphaera calidilacus]|uniref:Biopolymer transport protein ExbB n=1 Tax=Mucisphaera calidilacus TaxID=2527982 RepID=A0A518BUD3_9BACT|nr:MotA/TolQ/ExbB proton channel family protein [Mucisphaera calidilacus]QDU70599.1 Biopolymer transport protein ExbB [Mucisphaera calidilacus]